VLAPGVFEWKEARSLARALDLARGFTERADLKNVKLKRGTQERTLDVSGLVRRGDLSVDIRLEPEDLVQIPQRPRCFIMGPMPNAGEVFFEQGDTLYQVLAQRGMLMTRSGLLETYSGTVASPDFRYVRLIRAGETTVVNLEPIHRRADPSSDVPLMREDRIIIPDRGEVFVSGRVPRPGAVDSYTTRTAGEAVVAAGGALPDAALDRCILVHDGEARPLDLAAALVDGNPEADAPVMSGDLIIVPDNRVVVLGGVMNPGVVGLRWRCKLSDALASVGGPAPTADLRHVTIIRGGRPFTANVRAAFEGGQAVDDPALQPYDEVIVPEGWVHLVGQVAKAGQVPYRQAESMHELLATAGGVTLDANVHKVYVYRQGVAIPLDIAALLREGDPSGDFALEPEDRVVVTELLDQRVYVTGQVAQPRPLRVEEAPDVAKALSAVGGAVRDTADLERAYIIRHGRTIPVNLHALYYANDLSQNVALEAGDTLVVPENETAFVYVLGLVARPGPVRYYAGMRLSEAVATAGGYMPDGNIKDVRIVRGEGEERTVYRVHLADTFDKPETETQPPVPERAPDQPTNAGYIPFHYQSAFPDFHPKDEPQIVEKDLPDTDPVLERGDVIVVPERQSSARRRTLLPWLNSLGLTYWVGRGVVNILQ